MIFAEAIQPLIDWTLANRDLAVAAQNRYDRAVTATDDEATSSPGSSGMGRLGLSD
jgi:hypothetical protein